MQNFLGGWWDARLDAVRQGSLLEGGMRFRVQEHYPDDPDPYPVTWVPLLFYGPPAYPYQTPQVMIRDAVSWEPSEDATFTKGQQIEAIDAPEEEDSVRWRGVVHAFDPVAKTVCLPSWSDGGCCTSCVQLDTLYSVARAFWAFGISDDNGHRQRIDWVVMSTSCGLERIHSAHRDVCALPPQIVSSGMRPARDCIHTPQSLSQRVDVEAYNCAHGCR